MNTNNDNFGKIFKKFYTQNRFDSNYDVAKQELLEFIPGSTLKNKRFLDAGSGIGLYSLVASELEPSQIVSFDYDLEMVSMTNQIKKLAKNKVPWDVFHGSITDYEFLKTLEHFDYIYCWGVVHHTGEMWKSIENIIKLVKNDGYIYFGIYNDASAFGFWDDRRFGSSQMWRSIKKFLHHSPPFIKSSVLLFSKFFYWLISNTEFIFGKYKFKDFKERGMDSSLSIEDWLFGYPYEYASIDEVFLFMKSNGFVLEKIKSNLGLRTNHYLFRKA